jgi:hypothetical protein
MLATRVVHSQKKTFKEVLLFGIVLHPSGAFTEEDLQESSYVCYHFKHHGVHLPKKTVKNVLLYITKVDAPEAHLLKKTVKSNDFKRNDRGKLHKNIV